MKPLSGNLPLGEGFSIFSLPAQNNRLTVVHRTALRTGRPNEPWPGARVFPQKPQWVPGHLSFGKLIRLSDNEIPSLQRVHSFKQQNSDFLALLDRVFGICPNHQFQ